MKKIELKWLSAKIAELAAQGTAVRARIRVAVARARYDLWNEKRAIGDDARWMLLAYAFLRDVPYRVVEPTAVAPQGRTEEAWRKDAAIAIAGEARGGDAKVIEAWLSVPEQIDRRARRLAAERLGAERRRGRLAEAAERHRQAAE